MVRTVRKEGRREKYGTTKDKMDGTKEGRRRGTETRNRRGRDEGMNDDLKKKRKTEKK